MAAIKHAPNFLIPKSGHGTFSKAFSHLLQNSRQNQQLRLIKPKYLPKTLWNDETLHLPTQLSNSHMGFLIKKGWQANYQPSSAGGIGGSSHAEAQDHVTNRFLNSAARMQFVCTDPRKEHQEVREMVLEQMASGQIFLLDVASGNGAGTLAILTLISELRQHQIIPKLPLNINIWGLDISPDALNFYTELLDEVSPWLQSCGITAKLDLHVCNLKISGEIDEILDGFFSEAKAHQSRRFLCIISALSGVKKEGLEAMMDSLKLIAARLSHKSRFSSWLWVEPKVEKTWLGGFADAIGQTLQQFVQFLKPKALTSDISGASITKQAARSFQWIDPHNAHLTKSCVAVMQFKNL